jgi:hypothetical protein
VIRRFQPHSLAAGIGPLIAEDAGTVSHVWFRSGALVDTKSNTWTQNGTVPQVARQGRTPAGAGPFSDVNYYSLGSGSDVLDFTGDFSIALVFAASSFATNPVLFANGIAGTAGYALQISGGAGRINFYNGATTSPVTGITAPSTSTLNVLCVGRTTNTGNAKLNLEALASATSGTKNNGTTLSAKLGRYEAAGSSFGGTLYEAWFSTTTPSDALFISIMNRVKSKAGITAW